MCEPGAASFEQTGPAQIVARSSDSCDSELSSYQRLPLTVLNASPYNRVHVITVSKEDYLKAILEAESEGETVISATLAHWVKVSPPAVTMAVRRLQEDGLVRGNR